MITSSLLQSEQSQFRARGTVIRVKNTSDSQAFRDLDEHRGVFDIEYLFDRNLRAIERHTKDVRVRLSQADKAGGNEKIHELIKLELSNPILIQSAPFVADHDNLQFIACLKPAGQRDHFRIWLRLGEHEFPKLRRSKRSIFVEHYLAQVFLNGELAQLI